LTYMELTSPENCYYKCILCCRSWCCLCQPILPHRLHLQINLN
jgi:hypothetical protein